MFRAIISRDHGNPWGNPGMNTAKWKTIRPTSVVIAELIATQPGVLLSALIEDTPSFSGDDVVHVVSFEGDLYLEDGHHRVVRALIAGEKSIKARVLLVR